MQTVLKFASNPKILVSESQFSCCVYYYQLVNTSHTERTIVILLPSVGVTEHKLKYPIAGT